MEAFITRKKRKLSPSAVDGVNSTNDHDDDEPTEVKLAMLASLHPNLEQDTLLDVLLAHDGSVSAAAASLTAAPPSAKKPKFSGPTGAQSSLHSFTLPSSSTAASASRLLSRKGATLHLYSPEDVAAHTPCTLLPSFLPSALANSLLTELLSESATYQSPSFKLFDNVVSSPHTSSFYVGSQIELDAQRHEYVYNGARLTDVRRLTTHLEAVRPLVQEAVNAAIQRRIRDVYPGGTKLRHQAPGPWTPNAAFVNCYAGGRESVGWHSDQLTYLGPRAVIGSLSLGVAREFRVRRVLPRGGGDDDNGAAKGRDKGKDADDDRAGDAEGQIAIHLPHNSLLVMHAEMQEGWKHSVAPAAVVDPHPVAGNRRINVTYRDYRPEFHPRLTPRCACGVPTVLRVVQRKRENFGRYFWMCHAGNVPGKEGCAFFLWAEFDDDGRPVWEKMKGRESKNR